MDILTIRKKMDVDLGVDPEILVYDSGNCVVVRLSKKFRDVRYYQQFEVVLGVNRFAEKQLQDGIERAIFSIQEQIYEVYNNYFDKEH